MSRLMKKEWKYKIIAIVLSIIVWFYVRGEIGHGFFFYHTSKGVQTKVFENIPISMMQNSSKEMRSVQVLPESVRVEIVGKRSQLEGLSPKDIMLYARVADLVDGSYEMIVYDQLPIGVTLKRPFSPVTVIVASYHHTEGVDMARLSQDLMTPKEQGAG